MKVLIVPQLARRERGLAQSTHWSAVLDAFLNAKVNSSETRRSYRRHITDAMNALQVVSLSDLHGTDLAEYRAAIVAASLSPASKAQALAALRSFLTWSGTMGAHRLNGDVIRAALPSPGSKVQRPYSILSDPEVAALLAAAGTDRDRAILAVLLGAGLRVTECVSLDVTDLVETAEGASALWVRQGKGAKDRTVPIRPTVVATIRRHLADTGRRVGDPGPLFRAHDRGAAKRVRRRITARAVGQLVGSVTIRAGIEAKRVSPHTLRHTYAIRYLRNGGNATALSKLLGHAGIATTQRYLDHLELGELLERVPDLPGLAA